MEGERGGGDFNMMDRFWKVESDDLELEVYCEGWRTLKFARQGGSNDSVTRDLGMYIQGIFPILEKSQLCAENDVLAQLIL